MEKELIEYIRKNNKKFILKWQNGELIKTENKKRNKTKIGVMWCGIDESDENKVVIGFSLCNKKDKFDKELAFYIAKERANIWKCKNSISKIPYSIEKHFLEFINRAKRYYKDKEFPTWTRFVN